MRSCQQRYKIRLHSKASARKTAWCEAPLCAVFDSKLPPSSSAGWTVRPIRGALKALALLAEGGQKPRGEDRSQAWPERGNQMSQGGTPNSAMVERAVQKRASFAAALPLILIRWAYRKELPD